jgi:DNA-binding SARP family transcriptional activator
MAKLDIRLLGEFSLTYIGAPLTTVNTQRLQTLFAYLVLNRRAPQPRQRIAFLAWPDSPEQQARTNLRNQKHALERALPESDEYLIIDAQNLQWNCTSSYALDVQEFEECASQTDSVEALERAVSVYRGDLLPGIYDDFEGWFVRERERLKNLCIETLALLIDKQSKSGELDRALSHAKRLVQHDPLREDSYRTLMWLYAWRGDRAGVQRTYKECVEKLKRELDVSPSLQTQQTYREALEYEPSAKSKPPPTPAPVITDSSAQAKSVPEPPAIPPTRPSRERLRGPMEWALFGVALGVPLIVMVVLLPWLATLGVLQVGLGLVVAGVMFTGLFLMLVYRPEQERQRQKLRDDINKSLKTSRKHIAALLNFSNKLPSGIQVRVWNISVLGWAVLQKLEADKEVTLARASKLEFILGETHQVLDRYTRLLDGQGAENTGKLKTTTEQLETKTLPMIETSLKEFGSGDFRGDMAALEATIRALEQTLKDEGVN